LSSSGYWAIAFGLAWGRAISAEMKVASTPVPSPVEIATHLEEDGGDPRRSVRWPQSTKCSRQGGRGAPRPSGSALCALPGRPEPGLALAPPITAVSPRARISRVVSARTAHHRCLLVLSGQVVFDHCVPVSDVASMLASSREAPVRLAPDKLASTDWSSRKWHLVRLAPIGGSGPSWQSPHLHRTNLRHSMWRRSTLQGKASAPERFAPERFAPESCAGTDSGARALRHSAQRCIRRQQSRQELRA